MERAEFNSVRRCLRRATGMCLGGMYSDEHERSR